MDDDMAMMTGKQGVPFELDFDKAFSTTKVPQQHRHLFLELCEWT
jgi:hypothetical protein